MVGSSEIKNDQDKSKQELIDELEELREHAAREVQSAEAEVAVHEEVLQRYSSETAS